MKPKPPVFIVKRGSRFLVSSNMYGSNKQLIWLKMSTSAYDAWSSEHFNNAMKIAKLIHGHVCKFNRLTGDIVDYGSETSFKSELLETQKDITVFHNNTTYILREEL